MGNKINKTNAARLLDRAGIAYELVPYPVDEEHLDAVHVAAELGEPVEQVFKTLVLRGDRNGMLVCVIPGDGEVTYHGWTYCYGLYPEETLEILNEMLNPYTTPITLEMTNIVQAS